MWFLKWDVIGEGSKSRMGQLKEDVSGKLNKGIYHGLIRGRPTSDLDLALS